MDDAQPPQTIADLFQYFQQFMQLQRQQQQQLNLLTRDTQAAQTTHARASTTVFDNAANHRGKIKLEHPNAEEDKAYHNWAYAVDHCLRSMLSTAVRVLDSVPLPAPPARSSSSAVTCEHPRPAAPAPASSSALPACGKWTAEQRRVYFKDKICTACGQRGHSAKHYSCPTHPHHQAWQSRPAKVRAADTGHPDPSAAPPAPQTTGPSTSYARAAASELDEDWKTELLLETASKLKQLSKD